MDQQKRILIVNADDFGLSAGVNAGIIHAHEHGIVTSASLMVRWSSAAAAAALAKTHPELSVGLHVDLGEWTCENDEWKCAYQVVPNDDAPAVAAEIERQLSAFYRLMGRAPSHLDSHQHVHNHEPVLSIMKALAARLGVALRATNLNLNYCGDFYGQSNKGYAYPEGISTAGLIASLKRIQPGITEMGCHPAMTADIKSMYCDERLTECTTLCDPKVRAALDNEGIELSSFVSELVRGR